MYSLTKLHMDILAALMGTLLCLTQLTGCTVGEVGEPYNDRSRFGVQATSEQGEYFELPAEWKEKDGAFYIDPPPSHVSLPKYFNVLKWESAFSMYGDEDYAYKAIQERRRLLGTSHDPNEQILYSEREVSGYKLYVLETSHSYEMEHGSENPPLGYYWSTIFFFHKEGKIHGVFIHGDRFDNQIEAVEMFLKTFRF